MFRAVQGRHAGFEASYRRHLLTEQRKAVLELLAGDLDPDVTLGEVVDAAKALGWAGGVGDLSLSDLADALMARSDLEPRSEPAAKEPTRRKVKVRDSGTDGARVKARGDEGQGGDFDERMSTERAAELFVPLIERLGQVTMQELENETGIGRRKLRFHIGQLVRHGYVKRHGMGRGTHYTVA
jgi:hypothetical protein